jgi:hypothetical protein
MKIDQFAEGLDLGDAGTYRSLAAVSLDVGTKGPAPGILAALERLADITPLASDLDAPGAGGKLGERSHFSCAIRVHFKLKLGRKGSKRGVKSGASKRLKNLKLRKK